MQNDILSYLNEIQELIDAEFGTDAPNPSHQFEFTESQILLIFFSIKEYMAKEITTRGSGQVILEASRLMEKLINNAKEYTNNRLLYFQNQLNNETTETIN